jgi:hypothetical protein
MAGHEQEGLVINLNEDRRELPNYTVTEAAHCLQLPRTTLRQWVAGRRDPRYHSRWLFEPLIHPANDPPCSPL